MRAESVLVPHALKNIKDIKFEHNVLNIRQFMGKLSFELDQIRHAVPANHTPPGFTVIAHMSVEVFQ